MLAHLSVDEITSENGHRTILGIIEEAHEYLKDQRLERTRAISDSLPCNQKGVFC